jgi:hypothetical protein
MAVKIKYLQKVTSNVMGESTKHYHDLVINGKASLQKHGENFKGMGFLRIQDIEQVGEKDITIEEVIDAYYPEKVIEQGLNGYGPQDAEVRAELLSRYGKKTKTVTNKE